MNTDQLIVESLKTQSGQEDMFFIAGIAYQLSNLGMIPQYQHTTKLFESGEMPAITAWHRLYDSGHRVNEWEDYFPEITDAFNINPMQIKIMEAMYKRYIKPDFFQTLCTK